jgi:hypothetical protein
MHIPEDYSLLPIPPSETRFILVTSHNQAPVYTNGHSYSLRRRVGHWKAHVTSKVGEEHRRRMLGHAKLILGCELSWQACGDPPVTFYQDTFPSNGCSGCTMRNSIIAQLFAALSEGWIDLKSNKFKKLARLAEGVTK